MSRLAPLIISGPPRSGTTLLYCLFDGHPDIFWMISEGYFFEYLHDLGPGAAGLLCEAVRRPLDEVVEGVRDKEVLPDVRDGYRQDAGTTSKFHVEIAWDEPAFRSGLSNIESSSVERLWASMAGAYAAALGQPARRFACMKSPDYGKSCSAALSHVATARTILITRDPYYVANSLKRSRDMRGAKRLTWPGLAMFVASMNAMAERAGRLDPDRSLVIRYEDLVADAEAQMIKVARMLEVEMHPSLLVPTVLGEAWPGHSSFAPTHGIERTPAERKLTELSEPDLDFLSRSLRPYAEAFGYRL